MNKTNLEMFKMSKAQMNNVNGGKTVCYTYNRKTGESLTHDKGNMDVAEAREEVIKKAIENHEPINVACWEE